MPTSASKTFAIHYQQLNNCVDKLRRTEFANIDDLIEIVKQATIAHEGCKNRLESIKILVEGQLGKSLDESENQNR